MAMDHEDDEEEKQGIPEWVVTFGDMMSLLLTFFIMLVSMSEVKKETRYQALVDSMRRQFGYQKTLESMTPGELKPRTSQYSVLSTTGRAKRKHTASGGVPDRAPVGEQPRVRIIRPGKMTAIGSVIYFDVASGELDETAARGLDSLAEELRGKPQKIEIRGHTTPELAARTSGTPKSMALGYQRAMAVMRYLVEVRGLPEHRFRISSAGDSEPMSSSGVRELPRVEVFLLDESVQPNRSSGSDDTDRAAAGAAPGRPRPPQGTAHKGTDRLGHQHCATGHHLPSIPS